MTEKITNYYDEFNQEQVQGSKPNIPDNIYQLYPVNSKSDTTPKQLLKLPT